MYLRHRRASTRPEDGFTLLETVVALALVAVVAVGFMLSVALGFRAIAVARQRTTASELASKRLENLRNVPFERIAINRSFLQATDPLLEHSPDTESPNHFISTSNTEYDVTGKGDFEPLIMDDVDGEIDYIDDPIQVGSTVMEVYQYATWVDDPDIAGTQNYKRITVVVRYKAPAANGVSKFLRSSTLFTPGTVTIDSPTASTTTTSPSSTTTVPSSTTTTTSPSCAGDTTPPAGDFTIGASAGSETGFTAVATVSLHLSLSDTCSPVVVNFSNDGSTWGTDVVYDATSPQISWSLSSGNGLKSVYGRVRDGAGNTVALATQSVILDATPPTTPINVTAAVSCSGSNRTIALSWNASTDAEGNLRGYRIHRSTDGVSWSPLGATTGATYSDTHSKNLSSVRYYVVAYDRAGNISSSAPDPVISLGKQQCS
jgi:prepilin-type N-terminal cleavage/methylation domain-containing protein